MAAAQLNFGCSAAKWPIYHLKILIFVCFLINIVYSQQQRYGGSYYPPSHPANPGYQTYIYKDRRYGYQPSYDPYYNRGPPRLPEDRYQYDVNERLPLPGVLAGWREDLQGKERPDSKNLKRDVFVTTNYGLVQGFLVYLYDHPDAQHRPWSVHVERVTLTVNTFLGIPYAMPPIKEGRFKPPRNHKGWQLLQAVDWGPACPQPSQYTGATKGIRDVDEDCLYLNIFSPDISSGKASLYPVLFYIHGGNFMHGASNLFPGHILAASQDVVVVTINYRLGALGFLSTGDENSPGNYGLLDQAKALTWVYENIQYFNGDPKRITVFGADVGAACAGHLMLAPRTCEMVSKVYAQSGSALADYALIIDKYRVQNTSRVFAEKLGCSIESGWKIVQCLKDGRSSIELGNAELKPHIGMFPWAPVFDFNFTIPLDYYEYWSASDWRFFTELPEQSIRQKKFNPDLAYMTSVTTQEAADILYDNVTLARNNYVITPEIFDQKIKEMVLQYNYTLNPEGVYEAIKYMYTYWPDPNNVTHIREQYINLLTDFHYVAPNDKIAKALVQENVPVFMYVLNTTIEALNLPFWRRVPHNTEHLWLTGAPFMDTEFFPEKLKLKRDVWTDSDRNMSRFFMTALGKFAHYGNPTPRQIIGLHMETAKYGQLKYLNINTTYNSSILINYRQTESAFWSMYLPTVIGRLVPTYPPSTEYWLGPTEPYYIAMGSMTIALLFLIVLSVVCCMLYYNARRHSEHYYNGDIIMIRDDEPSEGIDNITRTSKENVYEFRDAPPLRSRIARQNDIKLQERLSHNRKFSSTPSLRSSSNVSLKDTRADDFITSSPNGHHRIRGASSQSTLLKSKTHLVDGVPQTAV